MKKKLILYRRVPVALWIHDSVLIPTVCPSQHIDHPWAKNYQFLGTSYPLFNVVYFSFKTLPACELPRGTACNLDWFHLKSVLIPQDIIWHHLIPPGIILIHLDSSLKGWIFYRRLFKTALVIRYWREVKLVDAKQQRGLRSVAYLELRAPLKIMSLRCLPPCCGYPSDQTKPTTLRPFRSKWWKCGIQGRGHCPSHRAWRCRSCQRLTPGTSLEGSSCWQVSPFHRVDSNSPERCTELKTLHQHGDLPYTPHQG